MTYIMVTGPMGAGKSTIMRSLPKPWGNFIVPNKVSDKLLDYACELNKLMFYEIDAPTATGKVWIKWLRAADIQIVVVNGLDEPDNHFIELWNYLENNTPTTKKIIILNRVTDIKEKWKSYSDEKISCVGIGEIMKVLKGVGSLARDRA